MIPEKIKAIMERNDSKKLSKEDKLRSRHIGKLSKTILDEIHLSEAYNGKARAEIDLEDIIYTLITVYTQADTDQSLSIIANVKEKIAEDDIFLNKL